MTKTNDDDFGTGRLLLVAAASSAAERYSKHNKRGYTGITTHTHTHKSEALKCLLLLLLTVYQTE
jgi:hypothetical protein